MSAPIAWGDEFVVNTTTHDNQQQPTITALADGRFVVAWTDLSTTAPDTQAAAVRAQIFNADGTPFGDEFVANSNFAHAQSQPVVTALADGGFVIGWTVENPIAVTNLGVSARIFDADGAPAGDEFLVNTTLSGIQRNAAITALQNGGFVVTWTDYSATGGDTSGQAVRGQIYQPNGLPLGGEVLINTETTGFQGNPTITGLADGGFVVSWEDNSGNGGDTDGGIKAKIFDADGTVSKDEFLVNTTTAEGQSTPSITALADGGFVVVWADYSAYVDPGDYDSDGAAIRAQLFNAAGDMVHDEMIANATTAGDQDAPRVAALPDGSFVVVWADSSGSPDDPDEYAVRGRVFHTDTGEFDDEFLVNTQTTRDQDQPTITVLADGRFVVSWHDESDGPGDTDGSAIRAQIFDPRTEAVTLFGTIADDDYVGTKFGDVMEGRRGNDHLAGDSGNDTLRGGAGEDDLHGGLGTDLIEGGDDNDMIAGDGGADTLRGDAGDDTIHGGSENDFIDGGIGNDYLLGDSGSDTMTGGEGNDLLVGGAGADEMTGGAGDDTYSVDSIFDVVVELAKGGTDSIQSDMISIDLGSFSNVENASLAGTGNLDITGSAGKNALAGNEGDNHIKGLLGKDLIFGGDGADTFVYVDKLDSTVKAKGRDFIDDFKTSDGDKVDLTAIDAIKGGGDDAFTFIGTAHFHHVKGELNYKVKAGDAWVSGDIDGNGKADFTIVLHGVTSLAGTDFHL